MTNKLFIIILITFLNAHGLFAQEKSIILSGVIVCQDTVTGSIANVNIYNLNKKWGTSSDKEGGFSIKMEKNDTIVFSTVQHIEQFYTFNNDDLFQNKSIKISMERDTVYLKVVTVLGPKNYEAFKRELLSLDLPNNDVSITLPTVKKYQLKNFNEEGGDGYIIQSPLFHLSKKIHKLAKRVKRVKKL